MRLTGMLGATDLGFNEAVGTAAMGLEGMGGTGDGAEGGGPAVEGCGVAAAEGGVAGAVAAGVAAAGFSAAGSAFFGGASPARKLCKSHLPAPELQEGTPITATHTAAMRMDGNVGTLHFTQ